LNEKILKKENDNQKLKFKIKFKQMTSKN